MVIREETCCLLSNTKQLLESQTYVSALNMTTRASMSCFSVEPAAGRQIPNRKPVFAVFHLHGQSGLMAICEINATFNLLEHEFPNIIFCSLLIY